MNSTIAIVLPGLAAAALAFAFTPLAARVAVLVGAIDMPGRRKMHAAPIPRLGGLAVVSAIAVVWATGVWLFGIALPRELSIGLSLGVLPILAVSALDDVRPVRPGLKLLAHLAGASIAVANGVSLGDAVHLFDVTIPIGAWAVPLSVVWLVGVTNALNLIDGLDGLAAGLALIASLCMAAVFALVGQPIMASAALTLAGALAGFLPYNLHPARLFLGDSGATAVGFCLGAFALKGGTTLSSGFAALVPVFIMGLPIADTLIAMARRTIGRLENRSGGVFAADRNHIHHRLLALGIDHGRAVVILYGAGLLCAVAAYGSMFLKVRHAALFIVAVLVAGAIGVRRLGYDEFAFIRRGTVLRVYEFPVVNTSMFVVFADLAMSALAAYLSLGLRFDVWSLSATGGRLVDLVALFAPLTALVFYYSGMYRGSWRVASVADLARACGTAAGVSVAGAVVHPLLSLTPQPASVFWIYGLLTVVLVTASRASYVVLRSSQRRASHRGTPVLVYGANQQGIAVTSELFENPRSRLRPIGFMDDDPEKTGRRVNGLPVLGRSFDLESLSAAHSIGAVIVASPSVSSECQERITRACGHLGIGLFRMRVQLEQLLEEVQPSGGREREAAPAVPTPAPSGTPASAAAPVSSRPSPGGVEVAPCLNCGGRSVHRSKAKGMYERFRKLHTHTRPFRCEACGWHGWLTPLEHTAPMGEAIEMDLRALDVAFPPSAMDRESDERWDARGSFSHDAL